MADETKDKERRFRSLPGQKGVVRVLIGDSPRGDEDEGQQEAPATGGYLPPTGADDDLIIPSRRKYVRLLDLGSRLRSAPDPGDSYGLRYRAPDANDSAGAHADYMSEYVPIELAWPIVAGSPTLVGTMPLSISPTAFADYVRYLLGPLYLGEPHPHDTLNPLGNSTSNGKPRAVPNCQTIWPTTFYYNVGVVVGDKTVSAPTPTNTLEAKPDDVSEEHWNPLNDPREVRAKTKDKLSGRIVVSGGGVAPYRTFDTSDTANFKITTLPSYGAAGAPFSFAGKWLDIYLVPELEAFFIGAEIGVGDNPFADFSFMLAPRSPWYGGPGCELRRVYGDIGGNRLYYVRPLVGSPLPSGSLVAILNMSGGPRYVWWTTDGGEASVESGSAGGNLIPECSA